LKYEKLNDFVEMGLHHVVTIYLICFSHITNTLIGGMILVLHDSGDIFIALCRIFNETYYKKTGISLFVLNIIFWAYTRLLIFPYTIYVISIALPVYAVSPYL